MQKIHRLPRDTQQDREGLSFNHPYPYLINTIKCGGIDKFSSGYKEFGLHVQSDGSVSCMEWAPGADSIALVGDFSMLSRSF